MKDNEIKNDEFVGKTGFSISTNEDCEAWDAIIKLEEKMISDRKAAIELQKKMMSEHDAWTARLEELAAARKGAAARPVKAQTMGKFPRNPLVTATIVFFASILVPLGIAWLCNTLGFYDRGFNRSLGTAAIFGPFIFTRIAWHHANQKVKEFLSRKKMESCGDVLE
ncbi:hypothetical protein N9B63_04990 [Akkermansiaceae bacterium]|nr:hypothetical protein [Akkermansiaceae bacterium]MDA7934824.1 hypothetical protein [Akkermansiaceae bacterium]